MNDLLTRLCQLEYTN